MNNVEGVPGGDRPAGDAGDGGAGGGGGGERRFGGMSDPVTRASHTAHEIWDTARESYTEMRDRLDIDGRMERNPYGMLALAVGAGYVVGGGIFTPLTGRIVGVLLRMALRAAAIPFIKDELMSLVEAANATREGEDEGVGRRSRRQTRNENQGRQP